MENIKKALMGISIAGTSLIISGATSFGIIGIVYQATGWKMPSWFAWSLLGMASVSLIIGGLSTVGGVTVSAAVAKAILAADSVSL